MAWLIRKNISGQEVDRWSIGEKELIAGRGEGVQARTNDQEMSRQHFKITFKRQKYFIQDLKSRNGTQVNGQPATDAELKPNDEIRAGESLFQFTLEAGAEIVPTMLGAHKPKVLKKD